MRKRRKNLFRLALVALLIGVVASIGWVLVTPWRRVGDLQTAHERDLVLERARPKARRPVLRGEASGGELLSGLRAVLEHVEPDPADRTLVHMPFAAYLDDLAFLRAAAILTAARRFALGHEGHFPGTLVQALGRAPGPGETDPYDGLPLRFLLRGDSLTVYSVGRNLEDDAGSISPYTFTDGAPDVGLTLPLR